MTKATGRAHITFAVDLDLTDSWGDDCTVGQVMSQAHESAEQAARLIAGEIVKAKYNSIRDVTVKKIERDIVLYFED